MIRLLDQNGDGKVTMAELRQFFTKSDTNKDGSLSAEEISRLLPGIGRPDQPRRPGGAGVPQVGDIAPDFTLRTLDGKGSVTLSEVSKGRPTVLIFGSYT